MAKKKTRRKRKGEGTRDEPRSVDTGATYAGRDLRPTQLVNFSRAGELLHLDAETIKARVKDGTIPSTTYQGTGGRVFYLVAVKDLRTFKMDLLHEVEETAARFAGRGREVAERVKKSNL